MVLQVRVLARVVLRVGVEAVLSHASVGVSFDLRALRSRGFFVVSTLVRHGYAGETQMQRVVVVRKLARTKLEVEKVPRKIVLTLPKISWHRVHPAAFLRRWSI
jgi:hypothetical protein